jgi:hypothetical protein
MNPATSQEILELINKMIEEHQGIEGPFHLGAIEALRSLKIEIINR